MGRIYIQLRLLMNRSIKVTCAEMGMGRHLFLLFPFLLFLRIIFVIIILHRLNTFSAGRAAVCFLVGQQE